MELFCLDVSDLYGSQQENIIAYFSVLWWLTKPKHDPLKVQQHALKENQVQLHTVLWSI